MQTIRTRVTLSSCSFFFNDTATTEISPLSLHDALPICGFMSGVNNNGAHSATLATSCPVDRKSTRLNSSHTIISYAVFCLKNKKHRGNVGMGGGRVNQRGGSGRVAACL